MGDELTRHERSLAAHEYTFGHVGCCPHLYSQLLIREIYSLNDVLSVKKEIVSDTDSLHLENWLTINQQTEGNIISLIPVNFHASGNSDLEKVVEETLEDLKVQMDAFDRTAAKLDELTKNGPHNEHTMQFVRYCRRSITGTLTFTMLSDRYRVKEYLREDGTMHIVL